MIPYYILIIAAVLGVALRKRFTHGIAVNTKNDASKDADKPEAEKKADVPPSDAPSAAEIEARRIKVEELEAALAAANAEIERLQLALSEAESRIANLTEMLDGRPDDEGDEPLSVEEWAASQLREFNYTRAAGKALNDVRLDPAVREKIRAGLSIEQAIEVVSNQKRHDAAQARKKPAKSE